MKAIAVRSIPIPDVIDIYFLDREYEASDKTAISAVFEVQDEVHELGAQDEKINKAMGSIGDEVVCIHDGVDKPVQENSEEHISIVLQVHIQPVENKDGGMMINMEEKKMSQFLSNHNEYGIPEVPDL